MLLCLDFSFIKNIWPDTGHKEIGGVNKSAKLLEDEKRVEIIGLVILVTK